MMHRVGITIGDPAGVGPEILLRSFAAGEVGREAILVAYGDAVVVAKVESEIGLGVPISEIDEPGEARPGCLNWIDFHQLDPGSIPNGAIDRNCGRQALAYIDRATADAIAGRIDAITTLPVNKEACRLIEPSFCGHTERLAAHCESDDFIMLFASPRMIVSLVSIHISLRDAVASLTRDAVVRVGRLTAQTTRTLRPGARIAIAGLNPHAGENGAFGREEIEILAPAVEDLRSLGIDASGPWPPDTVFGRMRDGAFDAVVAMYHDQGLIPFKLDSFVDGVNVTAGLPIIRTSVDHGTAFDIAYRGVADTRNFVTALKMAVQMAANRKDSRASPKISPKTQKNSDLGI